MSSRRSSKCMLLVLWITLQLPVSLSCAGSGSWYLLSRDDGCVSLQVLVRAEGLDRVPESPDDFARLLRARGEQVTVGLPKDFPAELAGKVVQVRYGNKGPIFVREDVCRFEP